MQRFDRAIPVPHSDAQIVALVRECNSNAESARRMRGMLGLRPGTRITPAHVRVVIADEIRRTELWKNDQYQVAIDRDVPVGDGWPAMIHLSIKRLDKEPIHDWRDLQEIKNQLVGPDHEAVELYPSEARLVDAANQYHLWVLADADVGFPFGFFERHVSDVEIPGSKQRKRA